VRVSAVCAVTALFICCGEEPRRMHAVAAQVPSRRPLTPTYVDRAAQSTDMSAASPEGGGASLPHGGDGPGVHVSGEATAPARRAIVGADLHEKGDTVSASLEPVSSDSPRSAPWPALPGCLPRVTWAGIGSVYECKSSRRHLPHEVPASCHWIEISDDPAINGRQTSGAAGRDAVQCAWIREGI